MTSKSVKSILGIGNALTDILAILPDDSILQQFNLPKGSMQHVDAEAGNKIWEAIKDMGIKYVAGGSAANTLSAAAIFGMKAGFIGKVGKDDIGSLFKSEQRRDGIDSMVLRGKAPSGRAIVIITEPNYERTFATYLGAALELEPEDLDNQSRIEQEKTYTDPLQMKNKSNDSKYLKYRNKHSFKTTIDYNYKWFSLGVNMSYRSKVLAVDYLMVDERVKEQQDLMDYARLFIFGYEDGLSLHDYWMTHNTGIFTMDLRCSVRFQEKVEMQFLINNLLNTEYSYRPMALAPPRTFVCRMNITF